MEGVLAAPATIALKLQLPLNFLFVFAGVVVFPGADRALQRY